MIETNKPGEVARVRLCVGAGPVFFSSLWVIVGQGNEFYVGVRTLLGQQSSVCMGAEIANSHSPRSIGRAWSDGLVNRTGQWCAGIGRWPPRGRVRSFRSSP